jgi:hypothetical protein
MPAPMMGDGEEESSGSESGGSSSEEEEGRECATKAMPPVPPVAA